MIKTDKKIKPKLLLLLAGVAIVLLAALPVIILLWGKPADDTQAETTTAYTEDIQLIKPAVTIEAGSSCLEPALFVTETGTQAAFVTDISAIDLNKPQTCTLELSANNKTFSSVLTIVDTTPPTASAVPQEIYTDETRTADAFVTDITDISPVSAAFAEEPAFGTAGSYTVTVRLTDECGNTSEITSALTIIKDTVPPEFSSMRDLSVRIGESVSYKKGVSVSDNHDESVSFSVNSSAVDLNTEGTYTVTYTATDNAGNTATATRTVQVLPKLVIDRALVDEMAGKVIADIITDGMSNHEKAKAVFKWVRRNMTYVSSSETDIPNAAYVALTKKRGDCYNYYAITTVLLDLCGIENMKIERSGGSTSHVWLLVNVGTGWYHYDTSPQNHLYPFTCFMKTDAEVWAYAKSRGDGRADYYNFDASLYPERATETYSY